MEGDEITCGRQDWMAGLAALISPRILGGFFNCVIHTVGAVGEAKKNNKKTDCTFCKSHEDNAACHKQGRNESINMLNWSGGEEINLL